MRSPIRPLLAMAAAITALTALPAAAQQAQSSAEAQAIMLRPLSFFKLEDLDFGSVLASNTAGTVRIQPNGTRTATGGVALYGADHQPAAFTGLGTPNRIVTIAMASNSIFITGPGQPMRVHSFEIGSTPTVILSTTPLRFRINTATGAYAFPLGASLDVNANQADGDYAGNFTIILNYL